MAENPNKVSLGQIEQKAFARRSVYPDTEVLPYELRLTNKLTANRARDDAYQAMQLLRLQYEAVTPVGCFETRLQTFCSGYGDNIPTYHGLIYVYRAVRRYSPEGSDQAQQDNQYIYISDSWNLVRTFLESKKETLGKRGVTLLKNIHRYDLAWKLRLFQETTVVVPDHGPEPDLKSRVLSDLFIPAYNAAQAVLGYLILNNFLKAYV